MKNIFITGARGFVGSNLKEYLEERGGYKVYAPYHKELNLLDENMVADYITLNKINIIIHAANVGGNRKTSEESTVENNLRMFFNITRMKDHVEKIIHFGSGAEYDKRVPLIQVKEEDHGIRIPADAYGFSKYVMSEYIKETENIVCLRLFGVFGMKEDYEYKFISNCIVKNIFNLPIQIIQNVFFDYLYINDCVRAVEWFIQNKPKYKFYNLSSGQRVDILTLAKIVNNCGENSVPVSIMNEGLNNEYTASNERIEHETGIIQLTSYEGAVKDMYEYYKGIIDDIDYNKIFKDQYAGNCVIKENCKP
jgi:UDP-glucose 4-epimerase